MQNFKSYGFVLLTFGFLSSFAFGQNILLTEDFDDSSLPDGWTQQSQASDGGWLLGTNSELQSDWWSIAPNGHFIATNDDGCDCDKSEDYLIMPELNLAESEAVMLQFDAYYDGGTFEGDTEVATIEFSLDEGFTWEVLETIEGSDDGEWNSHTISLNQLLGESDVLLAFRYNDNGGWVYGCAIDDVVVFEPSGLDAALSAVNVPNTVNLGETISVGGTVTNTGLETISSLELSWSIGENEFVAEYTDLILEAGEVYAFDHPDELTVDDMGSLQLNVSIV